MGGSAKYRAAKKAKEQTAQERRIVGRTQRNNAINSKTDTFKMDRRRIVKNLNRNYTDEGQKILDALTKDEKLDFAQIYNKTMKEEPQITAEVKNVANELGLPLLGEATRRKSAKSAIRKRNDRALKNDDPELNDMVRYTHQVDASNYGNDVNKAIAQYEKAGFKVAWDINNAWMNPKKAYKGVNVTFRSKTGTLFEVQFHTTQSHNLKEKQLHPIFEKQRKYPKGSSKYKEYDKEMFALSAKVPVPNGVDKIRRI